MKKIESARLFTLSRRLWKDYIRKHLRSIFIAALLMVLSAATVGVQPFLVQQAFDRIFQNKDHFYLNAIPMAIVLVAVVQAFTAYFSNLIMGSISNALICDMRKSLFRQVIDNEIEFYSRIDSGSLLSRITGEMIHIAAAITNFFNAWCRQLITTIALLYAMMHQSALLTVISLAVFVCIVLPLRRIAVRLKKLGRQMNDKNGNLHARLIESLAGVRTVKAFRKEEFEIEKISDYVEDIETTSNRTNKIALITPSLMQIVGGVAIAYAIWFGGSKVISGEMTQGTLLGFTTALMMFVRPVRSLSSAGGVMVKGYVAADRFYELMDARPHFISRDTGEKLSVSRAEIVFDHVSFSYPNGTQAVQDVNVTLQAGKRTALVGHSGSGKSTIFNLILKFYEPSSGAIRIDGQDLSAANINSVRDQLSLVSQDIFIFDETAYNNIAYGREGATEEEVIAAAKAARCHDFILQLPKGYQTRLGFAGESLSGGQKQRIAIARAFLRNAPILLLDEATSALDPRTEADIQASLDELSKGRTTIIIAHRLSTVIHADQMILMHEGQVAATGSHDELMKSSELYRHHFGL